jgi:hypothetical protein
VTWEAISATATAFTGIVIATTVLVGIRQLRLTRDTLEHLRRSTQLEGAMQIFAEITSGDFRASQYFILNDLAARMKDPQFRETVQLVGAADLDVHKELHLMRAFERIGAYVKNGLMDGALIYDVFLPPIVSSWEELTEVIRIHRESAGQGLWENYEFLYEDGKRWMGRVRSADFLRPRWAQEARSRQAGR